MVGTMVQLLYSSVLCCCWYSQNRLSSEFSSVSENSSTHRQSKAAWAWQGIGCVCLCLLRRQKLNLKAEQNGKRAKEDGSSSQMQCMAPNHLVHRISDYYATKGNVINTSKINGFFLENADLRRAKGRLKVMPRPLTSIHPILVIWRAYQISLGSIIIWDTVYPPQELPSCSIVEVLTLGRKWPLCYDMGWFDESSP